MPSQITRFSTISLLSACLLATQSAQAEPIQILTSIKPLQLITKQMLGDLADVEVLLPPGSSPHHYSLKPSAVRQMHDADLFIWGGEALELFLSKPVSQLETPALAVLPETEAHTEDHEDTAGDNEHHHDGDPHFWMAPETAQIAAQSISDRLIIAYPEHKQALQQAYSRFAAELEQADKQIQQSLSGVQGQGFFVFHDAFSGFVEHYGLKQLGYFTVDPGRKPGAKRLSEIRAALEEEKAVCVFVEPQFKAPVVQSITRGLSVGVGRLDPLATDSVVDSQGYTRYIQSLAASFTQCLTANGKN